jgi:hypothetical protein
MFVFGMLLAIRIEYLTRVFWFSSCCCYYSVRASCGLPGVMAPAKLIVKNSEGELEAFEVDGVEWIDGSVQVSFLTLFSAIHPFWL